MIIDSKIKKITIECIDEIRILTGKDVIKWDEHCLSMAGFCSAHNVNLFDSDPINWNIQKITEDNILFSIKIDRLNYLQSSKCKCKSLTCEFCDSILQILIDSENEDVKLYCLKCKHIKELTPEINKIIFNLNKY